MDSDYEKAENSPVGKRLREDPGISGWGFGCKSCPVLIEFDLDGFPATFRARGSWWSFTVGVPGGYNALNDQRQQLLNLCTFYDNSPYAGYMDLKQAYLFVEQGILTFRRIRKLSPAAFGKVERKLG